MQKKKEGWDCSVHLFPSTESKVFAVGGAGVSEGRAPHRSGLNPPAGLFRALWYVSLAIADRGFVG